MRQLDDPTRLKAVKFTAPTENKPKQITWLARTDRLVCAMQTVTKGGETNLHSHTHLDGFWFVLKGRARFFAGRTEVLGEIGPHEGVLVPRGVQYWFESCGEEPLQIMQIEASDVPMATKQDIYADRNDLEGHK